ncbi:hypothetical protein T552_00977 [Pneumocystis carinii B80]|uniref:2Fe-2S ferredoxin-type domain-containing protein n=1 Tax=Pneumocystis carinii (strain B80) TaxID=1408658 RepID=A0A0W4ZN10_PNEC8|nr:hypothetical protein T552_00977 [Pneumocystis carinii B80]KTW29770.1 hypothetical protein T552_00977 [Pneumocystis carinii B80]
MAQFLTVKRHFPSSYGFSMSLYRFYPGNFAPVLKRSIYFEKNLKRRKNSLKYEFILGFEHRNEQNMTGALFYRKFTSSISREKVECTFITPQGERKTLKVSEGSTVLDIAHEHNIDLEGACEGSIACSTCHVIVDPKYYSKMEEQSEKELDMLDLAFGLTETSRLGCQIIMDKSLDGITFIIPSETRNIQFKK